MSTDANNTTFNEKEKTVKKLTASLIALTAGAFLASIDATPLSAQLSSNVTVYASGLEGPRGLKFGPDGLLYVAEVGTSGTNSTVGQCTQVVPPIGPYFGGNTARISKISHSGKVTTVASGFPSSLNAAGDTQGVADIAFLEGKLYAVLSGAGCSHASASIPNAIVRVNTEAGTWKIVADLSHYLMTHPAKYVNLGDFEPDGVFYSLIAYRDRLYTVEPNHGQVFSISEDGDVSEEIDISKAEGHIVPTSIAVKDGTFYVGNLGLFPITPESSKILTLSKEGCRWPFLLGFGCDDYQGKLKVSGSRAGFTTIVAADFGPDGLLYALEFSSAPGFPTPGAGKVVRLNRKGEIEDIATGLTVPTGMTFGPDGRLYVSNLGDAPAGAGQVVRITLP
jgi:glucose/arabinose dehydrogenase